jgi:hypothetical protein
MHSKIIPLQISQRKAFTSSEGLNLARCERVAPLTPRRLSTPGCYKYIDLQGTRECKNTARGRAYREDKRLWSECKTCHGRPFAVKLESRHF